MRVNRGEVKGLVEKRHTKLSIPHGKQFGIELHNTTSITPNLFMTKWRPTLQHYNSIVNNFIYFKFYKFEKKVQRSLDKLRVQRPKLRIALRFSYSVLTEYIPLKWHV